MKDIYELLNDIDVDGIEYIEMETNEIEKEKYKRNFRNSIKVKNKWYKKAIAVASCGVLCSTILATTFPSYAKEIPIIGDIFKFLDNEGTGMFDKYKEYANEINITKKSKGISITINDAIFDGKTILLNYTIESEKDLGDTVYFGGNPWDIKDSINQSLTGSSRAVKIDDNTYIGQDETTVSSFIDNPREKVEFVLDIDKIITDSDEFKGNWTFKLNLDAIKGDTQIINKSIEKDGILANIKELDLNPISMNIVYSYLVKEDLANSWDEIYIDLIVKDDLGNIYSGEGRGAYGGLEQEIIRSSAFEPLKEGATKLIVTPIVDFIVFGAGEAGGVSYDNDGNVNDISIKSDKKGKKERIILDDIIIELKK